ncbi:MAG: TIGR03621 family F420-dependent LLM class oxidoreductase [Acidimicrobiales bacterium]
MPNPFRFSVSATGETDVGNFLELCRKAEDLGYSAVAMADHLDDQLAPMVALTAAAGATTNLRLLTLVLANDYRHPAVLAKEVTTLDQVSGGRVECGIGAGWMLTDYEQAGIPHHSPGVRISRLAEAVAILKAAFSGEPVAFEGEHYQIDGLANTPGPVQVPGPPIVLAGGARRMLTFAAREADVVGINASMAAGVIDERVGPTVTATSTDEKIGWIRESAGDRFTQLELQTRVHLTHIGPGADDFAAAVAPAAGIPAEEVFLTPHALVGRSVSDCIETLHRWRERWGISYIGFSGDAIDEIAPIVAELSGT